MHEADSLEPCVPASLGRQGQDQPLPSLILPYCNCAQHLSLPTSDTRLAVVSPFWPVLIGQLRHSLSGIREKSAIDSSTPEEKPARVPHPTGKQGASDWHQRRSHCTADKVLATYLLPLKRDKKSSTLQSRPKGSQPPGLCRSGSLRWGE